MGVIFNILVCEDDKHIRKLMCEYLREDGYHVYERQDGFEALTVLEATPIDLLITDIMMPKMDGVQLTKELRECGNEIPVIMITAKGTMDDKKIGFSAGTDDYMVKPIDMDEMLIRVSALLRRAKSANEKKITIGSTILDFNDFSVISNGKKLELPKKEFQIAFKLLSQPNQIFTRMQIMDEIWGYEYDSSERTVDVHIRRLREKFEHNHDFEFVTVKGLGYKAVKGSA